ncbi:MAG: TIGR03560 family F420-dependent LLM class oxidoreductase [Actinomycetota bacterium]
MAPIHFGALVPQGWKGEFQGLDSRTAYRAMIETARLCERVGYDSIWLYDHFHNIPPPPIATPVFECWTAMMAFAERTERVLLGQMVTCTPYRNAAYLAKISACVDVASNGRLQMGVGAGWYWDEFNAYGYGFPEPRDRLGYLADTIEILKRMWSDEKATYEGRYASVKDAFCDPKPLQSPRPPLWIGGGGEKVTLRIVAQHADYSNFSGKPHEWERKRDILFSHCEKVGRDPASIRMTLHQDCLIGKDEADVQRLLTQFPSLWGEAAESRRQGGLIGTAQEVIDKVGTYVELGASGFINWYPDYPATDSVERFATEVMPHFERG